MRQSTASQAATSKDYSYVGNELELFRHVVNWKSYFRDAIKPFVFGHVLEVGAGIGGTTRLLCTDAADSWTAIEPDSSLSEEFSLAVKERDFGIPVNLINATISDLDRTRTFDCILYIDVLEHIEDDAAELREAAARLAPGGSLIVMSPAHQFLYSSFDRAIGHYRRYCRKSLSSVAPDELRLELMRYLDSVGMLASLANRLLLKQSMPTAGQLRIWDNLMVPPSRILDPLCAYRLGKSILAVWRKL